MKHICKKIAILSLLLLVGFTSCQSKREKTEQAQASATTLNTPEDWMLGPFVKADAANPVLIPDPDAMFYDPIRKDSVAWEAKDVFNPTVAVRNDTVYMLYRAEDKIGKFAGTSRLGLAYSTDGLKFTKYPAPVLYPDNDAYKALEWEGGCEDPRMVEDENGTYYLTYTAYDGKTARLMIATSKDLRNWKKHGSVFGKAKNGKYIKYWTKAGSIIARQEGSRLVATKINGKYQMLWGESNIYMATSDNLIDWTPVPETDPTKAKPDSMRGYDEAFKVVFQPRKHEFDSELVEPGPPALLTDRGIVFIYNSKNSPTYGDTTLAAGNYAAGQVLLDKNDPFKVLARTSKWFITPDKDYEINGQVDNVCFVEGLAPFKGKWYLYYGTADSKIAATVANQKGTNTATAAK
ncbi:glycoside hydrolase family 130 protein [Rufibacter hautae]|uniref:Glycosidase n=1 Tax=Rufibacter hautae TaxID=2595005 RepID=A0A5B6TCN9_9BACT|nr:glycoside hydrolase family 130 protein [Rufibacter hautae]KAA3436711.1 glycosidase [Rufibacter hautae]